MRATLYVVDTPAAGQLATMARPRGGDRLADEMSALRAAGVDVLVSALCEEEYDWAQLGAEADLAVAAGLEFLSFPIVDCGVPLPSSTVAELVDRLARRVRSGGYVATHCWAGIGRSSLLAGATLVRLGLAPDEAWRRIGRARGLPVPENPTQEAWLHTFAAHPPSR
jgi:protein-tyrosine phosphatase